MAVLGTTGTETWAIETGGVAASVRLSRFRGADGTADVHLTVRPTHSGSVTAQLGALHEAYRRALASCGLSPDSAVLRRYFCSDITNQAPLLETDPLASRAATDCAVSWVGQAPAPPQKVALWAVHLDDPRGLRKQLEGGTLVVDRGDLRHTWTTGAVAPAAGPSDDQTREILERYESRLAARGMSLAANLLRTWFYVAHVDGNYGGLVAARRELFAARGLTSETHYVASTGIEGRAVDPAATVMMDAYAVANIRPEQIQYLAALDHLSPTHRYGVTFERGTAVTYRDRRQVIISGTASIDRDGRIVHQGDVARQLDRTIENIEALLAQAGARLGDVQSYLAYLRDPADYRLAHEHLADRCGPAPMLIVTAPVCRPGWLIEVECLATVAADRPDLPPW